MAQQYGIKPGDDIEFVAAADGIRLVTGRAPAERMLSVEERLNSHYGAVRIVNPFATATDGLHELPPLYAP